MALPIIRKQNIRIPLKTSTSPEGLQLKPGEIGTDGENLYIGKIGRNFAVTAPIGSVVLWLPVGFQDSFNSSPQLLTNVIYIPVGWKVADGSKIEDASSPFDGYYLPNLTSDIFLMGVNVSSAGIFGGTNDSSHKHNIAHHHKTFNGANGIGGYISTDGNHTHSYADQTPTAGGGAEGGADFGNNIYAANATRRTDGAGAHVHSIDSMDVGNVSTLYIDGPNHLNDDNPRKLDDTADFTEHRPKYMEGVYLIKIR